MGGVNVSKIGEGFGREIGFGLGKGLTLWRRSIVQLLCDWDGVLIVV